MKERNTLSGGSFWHMLGNFLLNFAVAIVWLGRWTIRLTRKLLRKLEV